MIGEGTVKTETKHRFDQQCGIGFVVGCILDGWSAALWKKKICLEVTLYENYVSSVFTGWSVSIYLDCS